ncbi:putative chaperone protein [Paraburkholderia sp. BL9I2N2]|nr:putative chaperone protein [Paraburkholderia sp. BL9I2N2]
MSTFYTPRVFLTHSIDMAYCAIDFGTSNSAVAVPDGNRIALASVEKGATTLPTAIFFNHDERVHVFGRAALAAYVDGFDGRLMRAIKSILGTGIAESSTALGDGSAIPYLDVIAMFIGHLKGCAQTRLGAPIDQAVLGRPVFFVDDDPAADARAQRQLEAAARSVGFRDIEFQYEPLAAAFDYESRLGEEKIVLVADIGGGTSDFSMVRVGPQRMSRMDRKEDVLAHHGVHVAGTDVDRRVELAAILREAGYRSLDTEGREIPNRAYFDLATWHLINSLYTPKRQTELRLMRHLYRNPVHHDRLMRVVDRRLGHALAASAERAKIAIAAGGDTLIEIDPIEPGLSVAFDEQQLAEAMREERTRIVHAARETARLAGIAAGKVDAVYFTGGSTGLASLTRAIAGAFAQAELVFGDPLASVATGLGIHAKRVFG